MSLRQGGPLSPFFFLLPAEGLSGLMHNAIELRKFLGFHFNEDIHFKLLQFSDDTIFICDRSWNNLLKIKALLKGFELAIQSVCESFQE